MQKYCADIPNLRAIDDKVFFNRRRFVQSLALGSIAATSASLSRSPARGQELLEEPF